MKKDDKYSALIQFIEMMNNAFDIMNIRCRSEGSKTRNKWKLPLTTTDDWRFWSQKSFQRVCLSPCTRIILLCNFRKWFLTTAVMCTSWCLYFIGVITYSEWVGFLNDSLKNCRPMSCYSGLITSWDGSQTVRRKFRVRQTWQQMRWSDAYWVKPQEMDGG